MRVALRRCLGSLPVPSGVGDRQGLAPAAGESRLNSPTLPPVFIDYRPAENTPTGVGHYTRELTAALSSTVRVQTLRSSSFPRPFRGPLWHVAAATTMLKSSRAIYFSPESLIVPSILGARSLLTVHDLTPFQRPQRHTMRNRIVHRVLFRSAVLRAGQILVPTHSVRADLLAFDARVEHKVSVIPEGSRFPAQEVSAPNGRAPLVLYLGTIEPRKNVFALVEAFLQVAPEPWELVVAGKLGWLSEEDQRRFTRLIDSPRVKYKGYVSDEEAEALLRRASIFAYPSEAEGFGLPPLEAMACGAAVLVSDDPALQEVVGDAGLVVPLGPNFCEDLAAALDELIHDEELRAQLGSAGTQRSRDFSWTRAATATLEVLRRLA